MSLQQNINESNDRTINTQLLEDNINKSDQNLQEHLKEKEYLSEEEKDRVAYQFTLNERAMYETRQNIALSQNYKLMSMHYYDNWTKTDSYLYDHSKGEDQQFLAKGIAENLERDERYAEALAKQNEAVLTKVTEDEQTIAKNALFTEEQLKEELSHEIPENIKKKYLIADNKYYLDHSQTTPSFEDKTKVLTTKNGNPETVKDMVDIAEKRGWEKIKLKGSANFRRNTWLEAQSRGIATIGYNPTEKDLNQLQKVMEAKNRDNAIEEVKDNTRNTEKELPTRSHVYLNLSEKEAIKYYPDLKGTYERSKALENKVNHENLTQEQKQIVMKQIQTNIVKDLENNKVHKSIHEEKINQKEIVMEKNKTKEKELER